MFATQVFARYAAAFAGQALPVEVMHHAKRVVVDWYASVYPGLSRSSASTSCSIRTGSLDSPG